MDIQQNINQLISTLGIMGRLSPAYENRIEAKKILTKAESAAAGLKDIRSNAARNKFLKYSDTQLEDVERRVGEHNRAINDLRTAEQDPRLQKYIKDNSIQHGTKYRNTLKTIETKINEAKNLRKQPKITMEQANASMAEVGQQQLQQKENFSKLITNVGKYQDPRSV